MARPKITTTEQTRVFEIHELFFSTTDRAGVILSGNEVFRRVAAFGTLEEMIGKPHNIIRHPDMPRAVFRLLWDYLEADKPIAAYVKNLAKDGSYYWVFALVIPVSDGYLSIRFKPSSPIFEIVQGLYKRLLEIEKAVGNQAKVRDLGMREAGEALLEALRELGFDNYDDFMRVALATEFGSRARQIGPLPEPSTALRGSLSNNLRESLASNATLDEMFQRVGMFLALIDQLQAKSTFLLDLSSQVSLLSLNSLIASHKLGDAGLGLAVVSNNLAAISKQSMAVIEQMTLVIHDLVTALRDTAFRICATKLEVEVAIVFLNELLAGESDVAAQRHLDDLKVLNDSFARSATELDISIPRLGPPSVALLAGLGELTANVKGLSRVHLIGRVEAAHVNGAETFLQLFNDVANQLAAARSEIQEFSASMRELQEGLPRVTRGSESIQSRLAEAALAA